MACNYEIVRMFVTKTFVDDDREEYKTYRK